MKTIDLIGDIDGQHWLHARVPTGIPAAQVRVIVLPHCRERTRLVVSGLNGLASEWSAELADPRENVSSLDDDHRVNAARSSVKGV